MEFVQGFTKDVELFFKGCETYIEEKYPEYPYYKGFDLMTPLFFNSIQLDCPVESGCQYLLALNEHKEPIAILKWKRYSIPDHDYVPEEEADSTKSYVAIRFVDVREDMRGQGIAKELVREWSNRLPFYENVVGGKATPSGSKANIHRWMQREINHNYYISEITLIEEWEEENAEW